MLTDFDYPVTLQQLLDQCSKSYKVRARVEVLDSYYEALVGELGHRILEGEVRVDINGTPTRALTLRILDRERRLTFAPRSPSAAAIFADTFLRAYRGIWFDQYGWVDVPVFTGPVTRIERSGHEVIIDCLGKESLATLPHAVWTPTTIGKGTDLNAALRTMLGLHGEQNFHLAETTRTVAADVSLGKYDEAWASALDMAVSANLHLFFDGLGRLRSRAWPSGPVYTYKTGPGGNILTQPNFVWDFSTDPGSATGGAANVQEVVVPDPGDCFDPPEVTTTYADPNDPMSPQNLARGGVPRYIVDSEEREGVTTEDALAITTRRLTDSTRVHQVTSFTARCNPMLEEGDMVHVQNEFGEGGSIRLGQFTIPLTAAPQTIGSLITGGA